MDFGICDMSGEVAFDTRPLFYPCDRTLRR
jgi:hypothetical protein